MIKIFALSAFFLLSTYVSKAQGTISTGSKNSQAVLYDTLSVYKAIRSAEAICLNKPDSAMVIAKSTLVASRNLNYNTGVGLSFSLMGFVYWVQSYNVVSLFYLRHALIYLEKSGAESDVAKCYRLLGRASADAGNLSIGFEYLKKANMLSRKLNNPELISEIANSISRYYWEKNMLDTAWEIANEGIEIARSSNVKGQMAVLYARLGNILEKTGSFTGALKYYDSSAALNEEVNNRRLSSFLLNNRASIYLQNKKTDSAISYALKGALLADSIGAHLIKIQSLKLLSKAYNDKKDAGKKTYYLQYMNDYRDSIDKVHNDNNFRMMLDYFSLNDKLTEMERKQNEANQKIEAAKYERSIIRVLVMFILFLIAGVLSYFFLYKQKKRLNAELLLQKEEVIQQKNIIEKQSVSLQELNDLKTRLFAVISHDLRTPVSNLKMAVDFFRDDMFTKEEVIDLMQKISPLIDVADLTMGNLFNWATSQMHGLKVKMSYFSIRAVVNEMEKVFERSLSGKHILFQNKTEPQLLVFADIELTRIIIRNLVSNAVKFTYEYGTIEVSAVTEGDMVVVALKDNGKGMTEEDAARLFDTNTHFSRIGTRGEKGTGLGLLLCSDLISLNRGKIWARSAIGQGSTFYFSLMSKEFKQTW